MTFVSPIFLWAFALAAPLIAAYLLKVRPRKAPSTALFLWEQVTTESRATRLLHRLRDAMSLALMLAALTAAAFAAGGARLATLDTRDTLFVIDNSVSMSTTHTGQSRLSRAIAAARSEILALGGDKRASIATFANTLNMQAYMSRSVRTLTAALDTIRPTHLPTDPHQLAQLTPLLAKSADTRLIVITDNPQSVRAALPTAEIRAVSSARDEANVGIVAADLRRLTRGQVAFMMRLASSSTKKTSVTATLEREGQPVRVFEIDLEPGAEETIRATFTGQPGLYRLTLHPDDALAPDNTAYLTLPEHAPTPVRVRTEDPYFFEQAVQSFEQSDGRIRLAATNEPPQALVTRAGAQTPADPPRLVFGVEQGKPLDSPLPRILIPDHPSLRYVDAQDLLFPGARETQAPEGALVIVEDHSATPLLWSVREPIPEIRVNLDPTSDAFFLSPNFPLLIHGAVTALTGRDAPPPATLATGSVLVPPGLREGEQGQLHHTLPENENAALPTAYAKKITVSQAGQYTHQTPSGQSTLAVSVLHPAESVTSAEQNDEAPSASRALRPLWFLLALACLVLLVAEETLYHRRLVG